MARLKGVWRGLLAGAAIVIAGTGIAAGQERRVALVLGNAQYRQAGALPAVGGNVETMAAALRRAGFAVTTADNLDRRAMGSALAHFRDALGEADLGFVYYSGLALGVGEREYLLPVDAALAAEGDAGTEALDLDEVLRDMQRTGKRAVVVLDPAAANPFADRLSRQPGAAAKPALGTPLEGERLFVVYAHRPDTPPVPVRGAGPDPFTAALAREMVRPGVPLRDSLAEVARALVGRTGGKQLPWLLDRIGGDLVLVPGPPPAAMAAKPPSRPESPKPDPRPSEPPRQETARTVPPEPPPSVPPPAPGLSSGVYAVMRPGTLFAQPVMGARGLRSLEPGTTVTVTEAIPDGNWVRVRDRSGQEGYVTAGILSDRWTEADPAPPIALVPRGAVDSAPLSGTAGPVASLPSGTSGLGAPDRGIPEPGSSNAGPSDAGASNAGLADPAIRAEQQGYRAQREARTVAERAEQQPTSRHWSYRFDNGDVYRGNASMVPDRMPAGRPSRDGFGVYRFANGQVYEGEWLDDLASGYGVMSFPNGDRYAGAFRGGRPDGPGVYRFANGRRQSGVWRGPELVRE